MSADPLSTTAWAIEQIRIDERKKAVERVVAATVGLTSDGRLQDAIVNAILNP